MPSPLHQGEGHGSGVDPEDAAVKDSSAYGARNVSRVAAGTGEALPDPATRGDAAGVRCPTTDDLGKWTTCRVGVGGGNSTG